MRHAFLCKEFKMQNADIFLLSIFLLSIFPSQIFLSFVFNLGLRAKPALGSSVSICGSNCHFRNVVNGYEFPPFVNVLENFHGNRNFTTGFDFTASHDVAFHVDVAAENGIAAENDIAIEPRRSASVYD